MAGKAKRRASGHKKQVLLGVGEAHAYTAPPLDLLILEVLRRTSSREAPLTAAEIHREVQRLADAKFSRRTIDDHLGKLAAAGLCSSSTSRTRANGVEVRSGWYADAREHGFVQLTAEETRFLADAIAASGELGASQKAVLWEKLVAVGCPRSEELPVPGSGDPDAATGTFAMPAATKEPDTRVMSTLLLIEDAMARGVQVSFSYLEGLYAEGPSARRLSLPDPVSVNPLALATYAGRHWLIASYPGAERVPHHFRLDHMLGVAIEETEDGTLLPATQDPADAATTRRYLSCHPYMIEGPIVRATLRLPGNGSALEHLREGLGEAVLEVRNAGDEYEADVECTHEGIIRWVLTHPHDVTAIAPDSLRDPEDYQGRMPSRVEVLRFGPQHTVPRPSMLADSQKRMRIANPPQAVDDFMASLASELVDPATEENPYAYDRYLETGNEALRNLRYYLLHMLSLRPTVLIVGRAPGRKGALRTGVPFCDRLHLYRSQTSRFGTLIGAGEGYRSLHRPEDIGTPDEWEHEQETATRIVWQGLEDWPAPPLLWNIYPFHAHDEGRPDTNRSPNPTEIRLGRDYVDRLQRMFKIPDARVYALGTEAQRALFPDRDLDYHFLPLGSPEGRTTECVRALAELGKNIF